MTRVFSGLVTAVGLLALTGACGDDDVDDLPRDAGRVDSGAEPDAGDPGQDAAPGEDAGPQDAGPGETAFAFRTEARDAYTRVDREGMPAVATAVIPADARNEYNDDSPVDDVTTEATTMLPKWADEIVASLQELHDVLDDDLEAAELTPCSAETVPVAMPVPECASQEVVEGGPTVVSLIIPDTLKIDTSAEAGFPNGRQPEDPVMDVTLAVILLDMSVHTPTTLFELPLNPTMNDVPFLETFPYLPEAHPPM